jgi:pullulanase
MIHIERLFYAYLDDVNIITILLPKDYHNGEASAFSLKQGSTTEKIAIVEKITLHDSVKYICRTDKEPQVGLTYSVIDNYGGETDLQVGAVIRTPQFDDRFYYDGPLGFQYSPDRTIFTLWAPTATKCQLKLTTPGQDNQQLIDMTRMDKGVWGATVEGDLEGYHYTYLLCINLEWREAVDPYVVSVTANGEKGVIVDLNRTPVVSKPLSGFNSPTDAIIYEAHIRDLTIHPNSGVADKGLYQGLAERDTTSSHGQITGLSYIKNLGVTHLELLPLHDYAGVDELGDKEDYNWGYNPIHFNAPEGSYSSDCQDPYARINELKELISVIHGEGLRVILDVVYNHVYIREDSSFEKIVPGYFFRHDENGMPSNGTGVGNDIASERKMVRKFIVESVLFWKKEYGVDGFRFDLMGILDIETMNEIRKSLDLLDPSTLMIGEGWDLNTPIPIETKASIRNQKKLPRVGQFNDFFRDTVKGNTFNLHDKGFALGNERYYEAAKKILAGSVGLKEKGLFQEPIQSVNYIESHDNHTFWDKLLICEKEESEETRKRQQRLATAFVLFSQGVPFIHCGQEFFRTKKGNGNSYRAPNDINQVDWDRVYENKDHVEYIKGIIKIRRSHQAFRFPTSELINKHMSFLPLDKPVIGYRLVDVHKYGKWNDIIVLFNPLKTEQNILLPDKAWQVIVDKNKADVELLYQIHEKELLLPPLSVYVLVK